MTKILLVDDREDNLLSIETILEPDGYTFIKANSGRQALKILLNEWDFALVLMDVKMPNLSGLETASLIYEREKLRHIPIIFITAHDYDEVNVFKGYRAGAVDYIYKPINPDILRAKINVLVELYKKNHQLLAQENKLISMNRNLENEIRERKISEEKVVALNLQLLKNIDKLEDANRDLDRVAFMASHDLQEPLRKIRMFSDRLNSKYSSQIDDDGKNYIKRIQSATERLQDLISAIMTFSEVSAEKGLFSTSNMNGIISDVLNDIDEVVQEKKAKVIVDELPSLTVNPVLMKTLFHNLITNSLKYSKKEIEPLIHIYSEKGLGKEDSMSKENQYCRIFVEDNGIGFEQKHAEQIFEMFKRLHSHTEYEGTGIGLALCKRIVEQHNGYISALSVPGTGSTFIVSLPLKQPQAVKEEKPVEHEQGAR